MAANSNPTVRRLELAARLRALRTTAGKSVEDAAAELMCSPAKISRMETGGRGVQPRDIRDLSRYYGVTAEVQAELQQLAVDAKRPGWWQDLRSLPDQVTTFLGLESAATSALHLDPLRINGLLQTPEFTRALVSPLRSPVEMTDEVLDQVLAGRLRRQARLHSGELDLHVITDEDCFRRMIGSPEVMADQIDRICAEAERPNVRIQLVPFDRGSYPGLDGSFQLMSFDGPLDDVVYVEGLLGSFILDKSSDTARYREIFSLISDRYALSEEDTIDWLTQRRAQLR